MLIELGRMLAPEFLDGLAFVSLADITKPDDFVPALAAAPTRPLGGHAAATISTRPWTKKRALTLPAVRDVGSTD